MKKVKYFLQCRKLYNFLTARKFPTQQRRCFEAKGLKIFLSGGIIVGIIAYGLFHNRSSGKYSETRHLMGTIVRLDVCQGKLEREQLRLAYKAVWERMEDISWRMNVYDANSDVTKINHSNLEPVTVKEDTYRLLEDAFKFSRFTKGAFDITVWPLIELWRAKEKEDVMPSDEEVKNVQKAVGSHNIKLLSDNRVARINPLTKIDLGGIAKGYAIDEAALIFEAHGIKDFYIDAGGDIFAGGVNCQEEKWRIGIRDPRDSSKIMEVVIVSDAAVATSGSYEQYYEIQGKRLSHILNPVSGYPQEGIISATVIAPKAQDADALSTALSVLDATQGTELLSRLGKAYASLVVSQSGNGDIKKWRSRTYKHYVLTEE